VDRCWNRAAFLIELALNLHSLPSFSLRGWAFSGQAIAELPFSQPFFRVESDRSSIGQSVATLRSPDVRLRFN
jgi:hypothetical protein